MSGIARRGLCLVLCAPSGGGKGAITEALLAREPELHRSISVTTREPRPGEVDGIHYHFVTEDAFSVARQNGELLEWARVLGGTRHYGTPRVPIEAALASGSDVVFDIDWQGHRQLRDRLRDDVVGISILPPGFKVLEQRLRTRGTEDAAEIDRRMRRAREEMSHWPEFDHVVVNDKLDQAVDEVVCILRAARLATKRRVGLAAFVAGMDRESGTVPDEIASNDPSSPDFTR